MSKNLKILILRSYLISLRMEFPVGVNVFKFWKHFSIIFQHLLWLLRSVKPFRFLVLFLCGYFSLSLFSEICGPGVNHFLSTALISLWPSLFGNSPFTSEKRSVVCPFMFSFWNPIIQILYFLGWFSKISSSLSFHLFTQLSRIYSSLHLFPGLILSLFYGMSHFCSHLELLRVLFYFLNVPF